MQAAVAFGQIGVATDQQNGKARSLGAYGLGQLSAGHAGHHVIGDQDVEVVLPSEQAEGGLTVVNGGHPIAEILKQRRRIFQNQWIVVDDEHGKRSLGCRAGPWACSRRDALVFGAFLRLGHWKPKLDRRAFARSAADLKTPARLLSQTVCHRQPETGALAGSLRGEEGFCGTGQNLLGHTATIVPYQ